MENKGVKETMNIENYMRQHKDILEVTSSMKEIVNKGKILENSKELALKVNMLAGKLKIHLGTEDKHLYPKLKSNTSTKDIAITFENEMGHIAETFVKYKEAFNIPVKIERNIENFKSDTIAILNTIERRIDKEERELYINI